MEEHRRYNHDHAVTGPSLILHCRDNPFMYVSYLCEDEFKQSSHRT